MPGNPHEIQKSLIFFGLVPTKGKAQVPSRENWTVVRLGAKGKTPPYPSAGVVVRHFTLDVWSRPVASGRCSRVSAL